MADKKADFKLDEAKPDIINTCWICGRKFLATHIMTDPVCPNCEKTKVKKVSKCKVCGKIIEWDKIMSRKILQFLAGF